MRFKSQGHVIGNRAEQVFIRVGERPILFVQQLQDADGLVAFAENWQAQKRLGAVAQAQIHFRFKTGIGVGVFKIHGFAMLGDPAGNSLADRQANLVLVEAQSN
jgi:hypothetical protein